jgi:hypothetical protein
MLGRIVEVLEISVADLIRDKSGENRGTAICEKPYLR